MESSSSEASAGPPTSRSPRAANPIHRMVRVRIANPRLVAEMFIEVRAMDARMAPGAEAGALVQGGGVGAAADGREIGLGVAAQAEIAVPAHQHLLMDGPVDLVAGGAPLAERLMLPDERPALVLVALEAGLVDVLQRSEE